MGFQLILLMMLSYLPRLASAQILDCKDLLDPQRLVPRERSIGKLFSVSVDGHSTEDLVLLGTTVLPGRSRDLHTFYFMNQSGNILARLESDIALSSSGPTFPELAQSSLIGSPFLQFGNDCAACAVRNAFEILRASQRLSANSPYAKQPEIYHRREILPRISAEHILKTIDNLNDIKTLKDISQFDRAKQIFAENGIASQLSDNLPAIGEHVKDDLAILSFKTCAYRSGPSADVKTFSGHSVLELKRPILLHKDHKLTLFEMAKLMTSALAWRLKSNILGKTGGAQDLIAQLQSKIDSLGCGQGHAALAIGTIKQGPLQGEIIVIDSASGSYEMPFLLYTLKPEELNNLTGALLILSK